MCCSAPAARPWVRTAEAVVETRLVMVVVTRLCQPGSHRYVELHSFPRCGLSDIARIPNVDSVIARSPSALARMADAGTLMVRALTGAGRVPPARAAEEEPQP